MAAGGHQDVHAGEGGGAAGGEGRGRCVELGLLHRTNRLPFSLLGTS